MFVLRRILKKNCMESNTSIGSEYSAVLKHRNPDEFAEIIEAYQLEVFEDKMYGVILYGDSNIYPLYKNSDHYIMSSNGTTFEKI